jgi:TetR/AcrR family transcriptional regulator, transcriptional repressor for nem operon
MSLGTRSALIEQAMSLVRRRGYAAFSYADLADAIGIRKPSIHHHFPNKEDLGVAIVEAYAKFFMERLDEIAATEKSVEKKLLGYAALYRTSLTEKQGCLCGVLAAEISILPPRVQAEVRRFFSAHLAWLERVLDEARAQGRLRSNSPARAAQTVMSTLQGALLMALTLSNPRSFDDSVAELLTAVLAPRN